MQSKQKKKYDELASVRFYGPPWQPGTVIIAYGPRKAETIVSAQRNRAGHYLTLKERRKRWPVAIWCPFQ